MGKRGIREWSMRMAILLVVLVLSVAATARGEDKNQALISRAKAGDLEGVKRLLADGANVNAEDRGGLTALMLAAANGHTRVVKELLDKGADVHAEHGTYRPQTALILASENGHTDVARALLERGADAKDLFGSPGALTVAARKGHVEVVRAILEKVTDVNGLMQRSCNQALLESIKTGNAEITGLLLAKGADPNRLRDDGWGSKTMLMLAAERGLAGMVRSLLENGADVNERADPAIGYQRYLNGQPVGPVERGGEGKTALILACERKHLAVVKALLEYGADVDAKDVYGKTAAVWAAGHSAIEGELIKARLARARAATRPTPSVSKNKVDTPGKQPSWRNVAEKELTDACTAGQLDRVKTLLETGGDVTCRDPEYDATPLHWAASKAHKDVVALLLEKGAAIDALNKDGRTPLMMAAGFGHQDVVKLLLEKGADRSMKDKGGKTALDYAKAKGHKDLAKLLQGKEGRR